MGSDVSGTYLTAILVPHPESSWLGSSSGSYDAGARLEALPVSGARTGIPEPSQATPCALRGHGDMAYGESGTIKIRRGGTPGPDALAVTYTPTGEGVEGCDSPNEMHGFDLLDDATAGHGDVIALPTGEVVACYWDSGTGIMSRTANADTNVFAAAVLVKGWVGWNPHPTLWTAPNGPDATRLFLSCFRVTATFIQVYSFYSDDKGATWTDMGDVLNAALLLAAYDDAYRLRAAHHNGQTLLVGWVHKAVATYHDILFQWASADGGTTFELVDNGTGADVANSGAWPDIAIWGDMFLVGYISPTVAGDGVIITALISSAFDPFRLYLPVSGTQLPTGALPADVVGGDHLEGGDLAIVACDDGTCWLYGRDVTTGACFALRSIDLTLETETWDSSGVSARFVDAQTWCDPDDALACMVDFAACDHRGRVVMISSNQDNAGASTGRLGVAYLGGWSNVPMANVSGSIAPDQRTAWERRSWPMNLWADYATWLTLNMGFAEAFAVGIHQITGPSNATAVPTSTLTEGIGAMWELRASGLMGVLLAAMQVRVAGGASSYEASIRIYGTTAELWDETGAGALIATHTRLGERARYRIDIASSSARAWVTYSGSNEETIWTEIGHTAALVDAGAGTDRVFWSVANGQVIDDYGIAVVDGAYTGDTRVDAPTSNTVFPRVILTTPVWLNRGASISAISGPGAVGDEYAIESNPDYGPDHSDPYTYASARECIRVDIDNCAAGTDELRYTWQIHTADEAQLSDLYGIWLDCMTSPNAGVYLRYAGAFHLVGAVPIERFAVDRAGRVFTVAAAGTSGAYSWLRDEIAGWNCAVFNGAGAVVLSTYIVDNREGSAVTGATTVPLRFRVASDTGLGAGPYEVAIWPRRCLVIVRLSAFDKEIDQVQVCLPVPVVATTPGRPHDGIYDLRVVHGPLIPLSPRPARSHVRRMDPGVEVVEGEDPGSSTTRRRAPETVEYELSWADGAYNGQAAPDYISASGAGAEPLAYYRDWLQVEQTVRQIQGASTPVVVVPTCPRVTATQVGRQTMGCVYGRIASVVVSESDVGEEYRSDVSRVQTLVVREVP